MKYLQIKTLKKGYQDSDNLLLHACFQILVDYVEKETENFTHIPKTNSDDEIIEGLYYWWRRFFEEEKILVGVLDNEARYQEATQQLVRLMTVRRSLWT